MTDLLYFATGDGANASGEAYAAPASKLYSIQPVSATTLDLIFDSKDENIPTRFDYIRLTITSNTHQNVIASIGQVISRNSGGSLITVCDADNSIFLNSNITDCVIYADPIVSVNKISGSTQVKLIDIDAKVKPIQSISLSNIHTTDAASTDLFLANPTDNYYIFKNVSIPAGTTLVLDNDEVNYDTSVYNLYVKLGASGSTVDVIIKS